MMSFWVVPWSRLGIEAAALRRRLVEGEQPGRRRVDGHRRVHAVERDALEQRRHVVDVADGHADLADLAAGERVIRVVSGLGREVEGHREARLPLGQVRPVELVARRRGGVSGVGAEDPGAVAGFCRRCRHAGSWAQVPENSDETIGRKRAGQRAGERPLPPSSAPRKAASVVSSGVVSDFFYELTPDRVLNAVEDGGISPDRPLLAADLPREPRLRHPARRRLPRRRQVLPAEPLEPAGDPGRAPLPGRPAGGRDPGLRADLLSRRRDAPHRRGHPLRALAPRRGTRSRRVRRRAGRGSWVGCWPESTTSVRRGRPPTGRASSRAARRSSPSPSSKSGTSSPGSAAAATGPPSRRSRRSTRAGARASRSTASTATATSATCFAARTAGASSTSTTSSSARRCTTCGCCSPGATPRARASGRS